MSTQYGTLSHRKTVRVPMWLIVALVFGALAIGVGYIVDQYQSQGAVATSTVKAVTGTQVAAGGVVAAREANAGTGTSVERAPAFSVGDQLSGGPSTLNRHASPKGTAWRPIVVHDLVCHMCR